MGCNCGGAKASSKIQVKTPKGTYTVNSTSEAKIRIALDGGGTYKAVPA